MQSRGLVLRRAGKHEITWNVLTFESSWVSSECPEDRFLRNSSQSIWRRSENLGRFLQAILVLSGCLRLTACLPGKTVYPPAQESAAGLYSFLTNASPDPDFSSLVRFGDQVLASSANGDLWRSRDDGKTWAFDYSFPGRSIASMITDGKRIWAVGSRGEIFASADAGLSWQKSISGTDANLSSVVLTPGQHDLWATGQSGTVLFSSGSLELLESSRSGFKVFARSVLTDT
jgi:hypothetical protein